MTHWTVARGMCAGVAVIAALTLGMFAPPRAQACGGFFCNSSQPVNQAAERIIFSQNPDGTVTAVIQIQYSGPSENFAWMLPVAGNPEVQVSSNAAFDRLQGASNPFYQLNTRFEGTCRSDDFTFSTGAPRGGAFSDAGAPAAPEDGDVMVVDSGSVGPYDYVVLSVDPSSPDATTAAIEWLQANGFDVNEFGADRLRPYLMSGMNLLTFRLSKGNDAGSIRPVMINFGSGVPSIPIRPTAVAANDDMGVMVWVLGAHRAVPVNYMSLEINEALLNWLQPNLNYNDVIIRAANEAGGQGFVTEQAGPALPFADTILQSYERDFWSMTRSQTWTNREGELLSQTVGSFGQLDGMRDVITETVPLPAGVTLDQLVSCVGCYYDYSDTDIAGFEPGAFLAAVATNVIEPMERTRQLFEAHPYVTRFYTTMSADEMTKDPVFDFNPDLADYSNQHMADRIIECSPSIRQADAPWRVEIGNGMVVRGTGTTWPFTVGDDGMPANQIVRRVGTTGTGEIVTDNTSGILATLEAHNASVPRPGRTDGGLCSIAPAASTEATAFGVVLGALGIAFAMRRRRRRS